MPNSDAPNFLWRHLSFVLRVHRSMYNYRGMNDAANNAKYRNTVAFVIAADVDQDDCLTEAEERAQRLMGNDPGALRPEWADDDREMVLLHIHESDVAAAEAAGLERLED